MVRHLRINPVWFTLLVALSGGGCQTTQATKVVSNSMPAPKPCRNAHDTYVYVVNGLDPVHLAGTPTLAAQLRESGFPNTKSAEWRGMRQIEAEVRTISRTQPGSRFALIGYSIGAYAVRDSAKRLVCEGIPVAVVAYIGGDYLTDSPGTRLAGVGRVVNITGKGHLLTGRDLFFNGTDITGAANLRLENTRHFDLPLHPDTLTILLAALGSPAPGY